MSRCSTFIWFARLEGGWLGQKKNRIPNPFGEGTRSVAEAVNNGFNLKLPYENITESELAEMDFFGTGGIAIRSYIQ